MLFIDWISAIFQSY